MEFSERLKAALTALGWSQQRLANELGSPASTISQWVNGQRTPDKVALQRLAELLDVDGQWLGEGAGQEPRLLRQHARTAALGDVEWVPRRAPVDGGRDGGNANQFTIRATLTNLAREAIQNSVDEWLGPPHGPVRVRFRLLSLRGEAKRRYLEALHFEDQMRPHLEACVTEAGDQQVAAGLRDALEIAGSGELLVLQISDSNTRGLIGPETGEGNFAALTRDNLFSKKNNEQAGGSYGLGKAMQYAASAFGCVLFSSELSTPEPDTGFSYGRFFARMELVYHEVGGGRFSGPMWFGRDRAPGAGEPISYWATGERDALLRDLIMVRRAGDVGTTIAIVGMRDLDADRPRPPREMVETLADAAERHFWPAILASQLEVRVQYFEIDDPDGAMGPEFDRVVDPTASRAVGPHVAALADYQAVETVEQLIDEGDVVAARVPLNVPARRTGADTHPAFTHEAVLLVRRARAEEEADDVSSREFRRGVLMRGARMVVKTLDLSRGSLGARPFQAVLLAGTAAGNGKEDERAETFLRAAEPPSHDDWEYTARLRTQYAPGAKKSLTDFEYAIRKEVRRILQFEADQAPDGPRDLSRRFRFGEPVAPERAPRVVVRSRSVDDVGAWHVEAAIRVGGDLKRRIIGRPRLVFLSESGARARVRWKELHAVGDGIAVTESGQLVIAPNTRTVRFSAVSDPSTHPAPGAQTTVSLLFEPAPEES